MSSAFSTLVATTATLRMGKRYRYAWIKHSHERIEITEPIEADYWEEFLLLHLENMPSKATEHELPDTIYLKLGDQDKTPEQIQAKFNEIMETFEKASIKIGKENGNDSGNTVEVLIDINNDPHFPSISIDAVCAKDIGKWILLGNNSFKFSGHFCIPVHTIE